MKLTAGPLFTILALIAYLPSIIAVEGLAANRRSVAAFSQDVANNGTAAGDDAGAVNPDQGEDNKDEAGQDAEENKDEDDNANKEDDANDQKDGDDENKNQDDNDNKNEDQNNNNDQNLDENLDENLDDNKDLEDKLDDNNIKDNLQQNIGKLMLLLGVCNFDLGSINGIGVGSQIQLLLQLQQLAQLQQLGLVNSSSIEQLLRQELLLNNFNLKIIKRTVNASVKQAAREKKRAIVVRKACQKKK